MGVSGECGCGAVYDLGLIEVVVGATTTLSQLVAPTPGEKAWLGLALRALRCFWRALIRAGRCARHQYVLGARSVQSLSSSL